MGNGKNKKGGTGGLQQGAMRGKGYRLASMPDGFIAVVPEDGVEASGYMVPKAFAALFYLFWKVAPKVQEKHGLPNPTDKEQVDEMMKRYVKALGAIFEDEIEKAILSVVGPDGDATEEAEWDFADEDTDPSVFVPGRGPVLYDQRGAVIKSESDSDEEGKDSSGGNGDLPTGSKKAGSGT